MIVYGMRAPHHRRGGERERDKRSVNRLTQKDLDGREGEGTAVLGTKEGALGLVFHFYFSLIRTMDQTGFRHPD